MLTQDDTSRHRFSTQVALSIEVNGETFSVAAVGDGRIRLVEPRETKACDAVLVVQIDEDIRRTDVRLQASDGVTREVFYTHC